LEAAKNKGLTFAWQIELEARTAMSRLKKKKKIKWGGKFSSYDKSSISMAYIAYSLSKRDAI
jgi:hypothetical protein